MRIFASDCQTGNRFPFYVAFEVMASSLQSGLSVSVIRGVAQLQSTSSHLFGYFWGFFAFCPEVDALKLFPESCAGWIFP